jgi:hypothetical protein
VQPPVVGNIKNCKKKENKKKTPPGKIIVGKIRV